ncbi:isochorismate synthase [Kytococcus aerolatus]|uniref:isochorismate synthase n=1 Tax=Kytococcus aerolatus TaxID=592308 RepID=A0A212TB45_9MICO|nr:isochorismate synthase [Kytococcus aerolatus]SNC63046.1 isochorismate synthase [Kytococcus aerolatus]
MSHPTQPSTPPSTPALPPTSGEPALRAVTSLHPADEIDLVRLLPHGPATELVAWVRGGEGMVGWGRALELSATGPGRWAELADRWREVTDASTDEGSAGAPRGAGLVAWVSAAFSDDSPAGSTLVVPRTVVGVHEGVAWVTRIEQLSPGVVSEDVPSTGTTGATGADALPREGTPPVAPRGLREAPGLTPDEGWEEVVAAGIDAVRGGRAEKVVLARDVLATAAEPLDLRWLLQRFAAGYPDTWTFAVDGLVGATPEMLVRLDGGRVFSRVLAGTIPREAGAGQDQRVADGLLHSTKDLAEHAFAVESVVERLAPLCTTVEAPGTPSVLPLPNVFHLSSDVDGRVRPGTTVLELAGALHPSAAVGGTPREAALELITELEGRDRDRYAAPVGWVDAAGDGDMGLALRCGRVLEEDPATLRLWAGGGIMADSDPRTEWVETGAKLAPMRWALGTD